MLVARLRFDIVGRAIRASKEVALFAMTAVEQYFAVLLIVLLHFPVEDTIRSE